MIGPAIPHLKDMSHKESAADLSSCDRPFTRDVGSCPPTIKASPLKDLVKGRQLFFFFCGVSQNHHE